MSEQELRSKIESFPVWHYEFELDGLKTPGRDPKSANRHHQRALHFFEPLVRVAGGFSGKRILDLGCNAGYWSLKAIEAGADFVCGIDGRQMHIDQANLVFEVNGVAPERYKFVQGDIFTHDFAVDGPFDVVLCLGLLYHVSKSVELFEKIAAVNTDLLLIDTKVSLLSGVAFEVVHETLDDPRNAFDRELVLVPTRRAVVELAQEFGYRSAVLRLNKVTNFSGMHEYRDGTRVTFLCSKNTDLASLDTDPLDSAVHHLRDALNSQLIVMDKHLHRRRALKANAERL